MLRNVTCVKSRFGLGWNPASNSEEGEGFVVREVQGRGGPLNSRAVDLQVSFTLNVFSPFPTTGALS